MEYQNKKNKKSYWVINRSTIDATNGKEKRDPLVLYKDETGQTFVRNALEFQIKFTKID